ncbi:TIM barrel protein [bacterium]|nr:TIM barrel protein [bacterium]
MRALAARLGHCGMDLTLETHGNTLCDTPQSTARLRADLGDVANLGICFQPYTSQDTEQTLAFYDALAPAIRHIHLQNRTGADNACSLLADGDWYDCGQLLHRARARGFDGLLSLEFTAGLFPQEGRTFDPQTVIDNAIIDRQFVLNTWNAR